MIEERTSLIWKTHGSGMYSVDVPPTSVSQADAELGKFNLLSKFDGEIAKLGNVSVRTAEEKSRL
jgi:hypothetical protein